MVWVLKTKSSQHQEEQEQLNPLLEHAAAQLVKKRNSFIVMT